MNDGFISRWSRRKSEAQAPTPKPAEPEVRAPATPAAAAAPVPATEEQPLPPVESLTPESDFTAFMKPGVDVDIRRRALKALLGDPRFNVMDGLDVYIDDYSRPDPLPEGWLEKMTQVARLGEHVDPASVQPAPDAENAAKTALLAAQEDEARAENAALQHVPADTSDGGVPEGKLKESPPSK